ncbi:MAG: hypothetical protein ACC682_05280 [Gemmatimonadota bacterium]
MHTEGRRGVGRESRERRQRRITAISVFASIILHGLLLWIMSGVGFRAASYSLPPIETTPAPEGLVVVDVAETDLSDGVDDPRPEPGESREETAPRERRVIDLPETEIAGAPGVPGVEGPKGAPPEATPLGRTNAERLTPKFVDGRIWFDPRDPLLFGERLARFARADSAVRAILREWLDSLQLDDEARRRAMDWTFEGKNGERWGISPEGLHLGNITIPIPFGFAPSGPQQREFEQAIRDLTEIQRQNFRADVEEVAKERLRAIEKRREEEIRRRAGDTLFVRRPGFDPPRSRGPP